MRGRGGGSKAKQHSTLTQPPPPPPPFLSQVRVLNRGSFGIVLEAVDTHTRDRVAVKLIERGPCVTRYVVREVLNHAALAHPHVIDLRDVFLTDTHLGIALELAAGGDLFQLVAQCRGLPEPDARWYFQQLALALDYCHRKGVANRDVKLENTLLADVHRPLVKLADFGYSKHAHQQSAPGTRVGTPAYLAPEVVLAADGATYDGRAADVWSAGVMLYTMVYCAYPFERPGDGCDDGRGFGAVLDRILRVDYEFPAHKTVSAEFKDLIGSILVADPTQRATLAHIMAHPGFTHGLPPEALSMNDACLALRPHDHPGYQSVDAIRAVVRDAAGAPPARADADAAIIEDVLGDESVMEGLTTRPSAFLDA